MNIFLSLILIIVGFVALIKGADMLVSGASSLAKKMGVSTLIVGLTVVAFGTSMPEMVVNVFAAFKGTSDIALGNIIGSNIANIALVLGVSAFLFPISVRSSTVWKEIPFALLAVVLVAIMANDILMDSGSADIIGRIDGLVLLSFAIIFIYYILSLAKGGKADLEDIPELSQNKILLFIFFGVVALVVGGKLVIDGAVGLASAIGMTERVIGLTVVALGTSLPELVTSVVAALKKQPDLSVGNIIGSNILNVFMVLGISATIRPLPVFSEIHFDIAFSIFITLVLFILIFVGKRHIIQRWQGAGLVVMYTAYMSYVIVK